MKHFSLAVAAATALTVAGFGLAVKMPAPVATNVADCPPGWYWDSGKQNCLPPGLPKDPPSGCLIGDGTHLNGTICVN